MDTNFQSIQLKRTFVNTKPAARRSQRHSTFNLNKSFVNNSSASSRIQFYSEPPLSEISLLEFECLAAERLRVLKVIETVNIESQRSKASGSSESAGVSEQPLNYWNKLELEIRALIDNSLARSILKLSTDKVPLQEDLQRDILSHFILRLAFCRTEDHRRWFLQQELDLFRFRLHLFQDQASSSEDESKSQIVNLLRDNGFHFETVSKSDHLQYAAQIAAAMNSTIESVAKTSFFKVHFTQMLDLVKARKVFIKGGFVFVPVRDLLLQATSGFRTRLSENLALTCRALPAVEEDSRLVPILSSLAKRYIGLEHDERQPAGASAAANGVVVISGDMNGAVVVTSKGKITADLVDPLSQRSFPLCMQFLHQNLKRSHHLKYGGRIQYGLFLKGLGLSVDESMAFWRREFCAGGMDGDRFEKQYAYGIRYNYGKEGKRADFSPYSCMKIITGSTMTSPDDAHGCPFRHAQPDELRRLLVAQATRIAGTRPGGEPSQPQQQAAVTAYVDSIMQLVQKQHYQIACRAYFELAHAIPLGQSGVAITHPNQYVRLSQTHLLKLKGVSASGDSAASTSSSASTTISQAESAAAAPEWEPSAEDLEACAAAESANTFEPSAEN